MRFFLFLLILISTVGYSQNSDSYFSNRLVDDLYEYFDSIGIKRMDLPDTCDCMLEVSTRIYTNVEKVDAYDSLLLNEFADDWSIDDILSSIKYEFKKRKFSSKESISDIYIENTITRISNRFNPIRWKRKIRYRITMNIYYKPVI